MLFIYPEKFPYHTRAPTDNLTHLRQVWKWFENVKGLNLYDKFSRLTFFKGPDPKCVNAYSTFTFTAKNKKICRFRAKTHIYVQYILYNFRIYCISQKNTSQSQSNTTFRSGPKFKVSLWNWRKPWITCWGRKCPHNRPFTGYSSNLNCRAKSERNSKQLELLKRPVLKKIKQLMNKTLKFGDIV